MVSLLYELVVDASVIIMMGIGSAQDIRKREIEDYVWFIAALPFALNVYTILSGFPLVGPQLWAIELALLGGMGLLFYYLGLFGGADAKALIALGVSIPRPIPPFASQIGLFGVTIFDNGVVLAVVYAALFAVVNLSRALLVKGYLGRYADASFRAKLGIVLYAYKTTVENYMRHSYKLFLAERPVVDERGGVKFTPMYGLRLASDDEPLDQLTQLLNSGKLGPKEEIWVSQGLPLVAFMFLGMLITPFTGDLVFHLIKLFIG
ncbi:MAG: A24 family peptidase C-terminal domain-containing protein [Thermoprotei archaeon]